MSTAGACNFLPFLPFFFCETFSFLHKPRSVRLQSRGIYFLADRRRYKGVRFVVNLRGDVRGGLGQIPAADATCRYFLFSANPGLTPASKSEFYYRRRARVCASRWF